MYASEDEKKEMAAFEVLFKDNYNLLCNKVFAFVQDIDMAADIVQNVFFKYWKNKDKIRIEHTIEGYLFKTCINESHNYIKSHKRRSVIIKNVSYNQPVYINDITEQYDYKETSILVQKAIDILPPACKQVFLLSRYEEMSHQEIADFLNISVHTVNNHIKKALKILRDILLLCLILFNLS
ncbi:MAG TPA: RNA polymerase sigma-70 factor [Cytophagales bacterium]|nr:RNA polymerase sigma-70 factor [Cytophagales bacterium]